MLSGVHCSSMETKLRLNSNSNLWTWQPLTPNIVLSSDLFNPIPILPGGVPIPVSLQLWFASLEIFWQFLIKCSYHSMITNWRYRSNTNSAQADLLLNQLWFSHSPLYGLFKTAASSYTLSVTDYFNQCLALNMSLSCLRTPITSTGSDFPAYVLTLSSLEKKIINARIRQTVS